MTSTIVTRHARYGQISAFLLDKLLTPYVPFSTITEFPIVINIAQFIVNNNSTF